MSQFRDGSFGRLSKSEGGMPVNSSAVRIPDFGLGVMGSFGTSWAVIGAGEVVGVDEEGGGGGAVMPADSSRRSGKSASRLEIIDFARYRPGCRPLYQFADMTRSFDFDTCTYVS